MVLHYRHWLIRCAPERVAGFWCATVEVWRPARDPENAGEIVPLTKLFDDAADACVDGLEAAKRWIDARSGGVPPAIDAQAQLVANVSDTVSPVTMLILGRPLCLPCIATKARATEADAQAALTSIGALRDLRRRDHERCRGCGEVRRAFWLDAPSR